MADSEDENEKGRRGKFRRERGDSDDRSRPNRDTWDRRRESWDDRERGKRRDYDRGLRRARRDGSPSYKRAKHDWGEGFYFDPYAMPPPWPGMGPPPEREFDAGPTQPPLLSFRQYLNSQADEVDETMAVEKYAEYKKTFRRKLVLDYFDAHKNEDWLRVRYHPVESVSLKKEEKESVERRKKAFLKLRELGWLDKASLDVEKSDEIVKILDAGLILLEGGSEFDLGVLDEVEEKGKEEEEGEGEEKKGEGEPGKGEPGKGEEQAKPKPLHMTKSVYIRTVAPSIKRSEIIELAEKIPGYLRTGMGDPVPERKFHCRGWITFDHTVDIKEVCSKLNTAKVNDFELNVMVNHDRTHRIRHVSGFSVVDSVAHKELGEAIRLLKHFDNGTGVWAGEESGNPVVTEVGRVYEETVVGAKKEEGGPPGEEAGEEADEGKAKLLRNDDILKALDLAVFYLRFVHSFDFYEPKDYPNEDWMPNRCYLLHVRGLLPSRPSDSDMDEYLNRHLKRLEPFYQKYGRIPDEEAELLGLKDEETAGEAFIKANSQELGKERWLCPLSGKKFRGPEFIRKHILNKHMDKVEAARHQVQFLNNYIRDPLRPQLPPAPATRERGGAGRSRHSWPSRPPMPPPPVMYGSPPYPAPHSMQKRGRRDPRALREYHDLDAPEEMDF